MKLRYPAGLAGIALALLLAAPAVAAPVTAELRIEGPSGTIFEGPVTTDVRTFGFDNEVMSHTCDGTSANGGPSPVPVPTRGALIAEAARLVPFAMTGNWDFNFASPLFTGLAGQDVRYDGVTERYLVEYKNGEPAQVGACADPIAPGDDIVFGYAQFDDRVLKLSGPARVAPGGIATVRVTDAGTGAPVALATVLGTPTNADGYASVGPFTTRGDNDLKATKPDALVSNRLRVCVTDGADGACGSEMPSRDTTAPTGTIAGLRNGQTFARKRAPRELKGTVTADPSGLWAVKIRLTRRVGKTCWYFSGTRERFLERTCGKKYAFKVGDRPDWSYLLPSRLPRGRYVLELYAIDNAFNKGTPKRVTFRVR